ncbi:MAG: Gfo/Idh/MocA family oxidoreductase [Planctomycetes bacterium]|nr:Gfo/Idh/MocA family oxidoreductase [Planctomycetota bacterium]
MGKLKTVMVGLSFGAELLEDAPEFEYFELVGGFARTPATREKFSKQFGVRGYSSYEEALADKDVDAVAIVTPNDTHRDLCVPAAKAGKHVFVDKPIDNTIEAGREIIAACAEAGVTLAVGHNSRRSSSYRAAKKMIDAGKLGKVVLSEANFSHRGGMDVTPDEWRWYRDRCPGGPLMQLSVHNFDTLYYLFGSVKSVCAKLARLATPAEIEDTAITALEFESGMLAYVGTAYTVPSTAFMNIYGTEARLSILRRSDEIEVVDKEGKGRHIKIEDQVNTRAEELDDFARCALTGEPPETGGDEALHALAVALAALKSSEEKRTVTISEILSK